MELISPGDSYNNKASAIIRIMHELEKRSPRAAKITSYQVIRRELLGENGQLQEQNSHQETDQCIQ